MSNKIGLTSAIVAVFFAGGTAGSYELKLNGAPADNRGAFVPGADFPAPATGDGALTADSVAMMIASEVAWRDSLALGVSGTQARRSQDFSFLIDADGSATPPEQFAGGQSGARFYIDLDLTNAVFSDNLAVSAETFFTVVGSATALQQLSGVIIVDPAPEGRGTGMQGQNSVRLQLQVPASANVDDIYFSVPLEISNAICSSVNDASLSVTLYRVAGTGSTETVTRIGNPLSKTFLQCGTAYRLRLAADTAVGGGSSALTAPGFNEFVASVAGPTIDLNGDEMGTGVPQGTSLADTATRAAVGVFEIIFAPDATAAKGDLRFVHNLAEWQRDAFSGDLATLFVAGSQINVTVQTLSSGNLGSAQIGVGSSPPTAQFTEVASGLGSVSQVVYPGPSGVTINTSNFSQAIFVTFGSAPASGETISATATINFAPNTQLYSRFAGGRLSFGSPVQLDGIGFQAGYCGEFDWVSSSNDRFDMIRITGHGANVTAVVATLRNVNVAEGAMPPAPHTWERSAFDQISNGDQNRELIITAADLRRALGDFGVGDLQLMVMGAGSDLDCDRLISTGSSGFVSPYGNDASVANSDGDD